jgi:excisionase family DNA binding protein
MTTTDNSKEDLLTVHEVAEKLRVDSSTVRRWIRNGSLEGITLPHPGKRRIYRVHQRILDQLLNGQALLPNS